MAAAKYRCFACHKNVAATSDDHYYRHDREKGTECTRSKRDIPTWLLKRGPETGPDDDRPVIGRDYAPCPQCTGSPLLDGATGNYSDHLREGETPTSKRVPCPGSGQPYEGEECRTGSGIAAGPSPATTTPPVQAATGLAPTRDAAPAQPEPTEAEEMISKWAATAREIEDRKLPPPSPESTTTQSSSPLRQSASGAESRTSDATPSAPTAPASSATDAPQAASPAPESVPRHQCHWKDEHEPHKWMNGKRQAQCPGKPVPTTAPTESATATRPPADGAAAASEDAPPSTSATSEPTPPDIAALAAVFPKLPPESAAPSNAPAAEPSTAATPPTPAAAPPSSSPFAQPGSPFSQPGTIEPAPAAVPMTVRGEQLAASLRQLFFDYDHRRSADNRGAQTTLGPSEIGTPCDRRLAMSLLGIPAVNPGGDGWAAFIGTAVHEALARMFQWADAGSGRYAVETPLTFPSAHVPRGTADLLDRTACMVDDHKIQGKWSQNKLRTEGIPPGYRVQLHTYGYGKRLKGEVVDYVALISWPREASSLDDLYVVVEPYDPAVARDALARVDRIAASLRPMQDARSDAAHAAGERDMARVNLRIAREFSVDPESCRFCPFFAPGDAAMERGCHGRQ